MKTVGGPSALLRRPQAWRSAGLVLLCVFTATSAVSYASARDALERGLSLDTAASGGMMLVWLVGCALAVLTIWRRRWPELLIALSAAAALLLPLDPTPALVGWVGIIGQRDGWRLLPWSVPTAAGTLAATYRDGRGSTPETSLWQAVLSSPDELAGALSWFTVALIATVVFCAATALGVTLRVMGRNRDLSRQDSERISRLNELQATIERQSERERLARDVHDALGHRLSLLSLHAGALQTASTTDDAVQRSAALIQDNARQSVLDLQALLGTLREPSETPLDDAPGREGIQQLLDEALAAGAPVVGIISCGPEPMHPVLDHTVYRVVQELLTNARRHAPGVPVRLNVVASPLEGTEISTVNALPRGAVPRPPGHGLTGMQERVAMVGGRSQVGVDEPQNAFRVSVWLPWETT